MKNITNCLYFVIISIVGKIMTPIEITVVIFPLIVINLTLLLFFATRSKDKIDKIIELKEKYITHLSKKLANILKDIDEKKLDAFKIIGEMNALLDIYYDMGEFWCDYNYRCNKGILRILGMNFILIALAFVFLLMTTFITERGTIIIYGGFAIFLLLWSVYNIGCGIFKVIKEGTMLSEFEKELS